MPKQAICHPEKNDVAGGLCKSCYSKKWRAENRDKNLASQRERHRRWAAKPESKAQRSKWYQKGKEKYTARAKEWRKENPERAHEIWLKCTYGLAAEDYRRMLADQGGLCTICRKGFVSGRFKRPCVDHDHATGKVRGLLCHHCNTMLGLAEDDAVRLQRAAAYLARKV